MSNDFFKFDFEQMYRAFSNMEKKYNEIDKRLRDDISKRVLSNAGEIFLNEQKRILAQKSPRLAELLRVWIKPTKNGFQLNVGLPGTVTKEEAILANVIEFGRPGARTVKNGGKDVIGRKVGKVEPYSFVRASRFLKGEEVMKEIEKELEEEIKKIWEA